MSFFTERGARKKESGYEKRDAHQGQKEIVPGQGK